MKGRGQMSTRPLIGLKSMQFLSLPTHAARSSSLGHHLNLGLRLCRHGLYEAVLSHGVCPVPFVLQPSDLGRTAAQCTSQKLPVVFLPNGRASAVALPDCQLGGLLVGRHVSARDHSPGMGPSIAQFLLPCPFALGGSLDLSVLAID